MKQKIEDIKVFIKYYSRLNIEEKSIELEDDIAYMNELLYLAEAVGTDKEFYIFYLMSEGRTLEKVGKVFSLSRERVRQVYDDVIIKIINKQ